MFYTDQLVCHVKLVPLDHGRQLISNRNFGDLYIFVQYFLLTLYSFPMGSENIYFTSVVFSFNSSLLHL